MFETLKVCVFKLRDAVVQRRHEEEATYAAEFLSLLSDFHRWIASPEFLCTIDDEACISDCETALAECEHHLKREPAEGFTAPAIDPSLILVLIQYALKLLELLKK